jgi:hypothetical protein
MVRLDAELGVGGVLALAGTDMLEQELSHRSDGSRIISAAH